MSDTLSVWGLGFGTSCGIGTVAVGVFHYWLTERHLGLEPPKEKRTSPWLTGLLERIFFTLAVAMNAPGVLPAMITWLGLKLAANWNRTRTITKNEEVTIKNYAFAALVTGLLSMLFAYVGGLIISCWHEAALNFIVHLKTFLATQ
jgi:hypothetical protein